MESNITPKDDPVYNLVINVINHYNEYLKISSPKQEKTSQICWICILIGSIIFISIIEATIIFTSVSTLLILYSLHYLFGYCIFDTTSKTMIFDYHYNYNWAAQIELTRYNAHFIKLDFINNMTNEEWFNYKFQISIGNKNNKIDNQVMRIIDDLRTK